MFRQNMESFQNGAALSCSNAVYHSKHRTTLTLRLGAVLNCATPLIWWILWLSFKRMISTEWKKHLRYLSEDATLVSLSFSHNSNRIGQRLLWFEVKWPLYESVFNHFARILSYHWSGKRRPAKKRYIFLRLMVNRLKSLVSSKTFRRQRSLRPKPFLILRVSFVSETTFKWRIFRCHIPFLCKVKVALRYTYLPLSRELASLYGSPIAIDCGWLNKKGMLDDCEDLAARRLEASVYVVIIYVLCTIVTQWIELRVFFICKYVSL